MLQRVLRGFGTGRVTPVGFFRLEGEEGQVKCPGLIDRPDPRIAEDPEGRRTPGRLNRSQPGGLTVAKFLLEPAEV
jgi:hypothetical protein